MSCCSPTRMGLPPRARASRATRPPHRRTCTTATRTPSSCSTGRCASSSAARNASSSRSRGSRCRRGVLHTFGAAGERAHEVRQRAYTLLRARDVHARADDRPERRGQTSRLGRLRRTTRRASARPTRRAAVVCRLGGDEGETITSRPGRRVTLLSDTEELAVSESVYGPGERGPDLHVHRDHTDAWLVLEGALTFRAPRRARVRGARGLARDRPAARRPRLLEREGDDGPVPQPARALVRLRRVPARAEPRVRPARPACRRWCGSRLGLSFAASRGRILPAMQREAGASRFPARSSSIPAWVG